MKKVRQCRAAKTGALSGNKYACTLNEKHREPHFHDGIETYLMWLRRGQKPSEFGNVSEATGSTAHAHIDMLELVIKARKARLARYQQAHRHTSALC